MAMYAMATLPLIKCLQKEADVEQIWYAEDSAAAGGMNQLHRWWDEIVEEVWPLDTLQTRPRYRLL